ncbi:MAG: hypothetical protein ABIR16_07585 [Dokdonella sp.]
MASIALKDGAIVAARCWGGSEPDRITALYSLPIVVFVILAYAGIHFDFAVFSMTGRRSKWIDQPAAVEKRLRLRGKDEEKKVDRGWIYSAAKSILE